MKIYMSNIEQIKNVSDLEKNLSEPELARYTKFVNKRRKLQYLLSHSIVKNATGENIITDKSGAPKIKSGFVSIAHKDNLVFVAISDSPVGIDIENASVERDFARQSELLGLPSTNDRNDFYKNFVEYESRYKFGKNANLVKVHFFESGKYLIGICSNKPESDIHFVSSGAK